MAPRNPQHTIVCTPEKTLVERAYWHDNHLMICSTHKEKWSAKQFSAADFLHLCVEPLHEVGQGLGLARVHHAAGAV